MLLQRERLLLELLVFKLTELGHLLASGDPRFLGWAAEEVERAVEAVRVCELDRAVHVQDAAAALLGDAAIDERALLQHLAQAAGEPWATQLSEHRDALTGLAVEVGEGLRSTRLLAEAGSGALDALLDRVGTPAAAPATSGPCCSGSPRPSTSPGPPSSPSTGRP